VRLTYPLKGAVDYALAVLIAVPALPLILVSMALVKITSRGPAVYSQTRVGRGGRVFTIYKIRSMFHDCEKVTGIQWSVKGDRRITPLGHVLRVLHLDELPQLWNVLIGDMSLIGPRPERPEIVDDLRVTLGRGYDIRHAVKPGLTGFAQIHLPPDSSVRTAKNKLVYDRYYVDRMGLLMDLRILFLTALKVVGLKKLYRRGPRHPAGE
jgi:lipopolysaccharide/colanic/teichoic acid biosynthesis glycosyltransferase